jgi:uncharacterized phiE125 gp8 family phage protein
MLSAILTTEPTIEPVTLAEAQAHLIINGQDDYINSLITTARQMVERYLNRSLILQTWTAYSDEWCRELLLPNGPLLSVTSVKYRDTGGTLRTLDASNYWVNTVDDRIRLVYDFTAPELQLGRPNKIEILYTAGYLATGTDAEKQAAVPSAIKHGMKILITDMHEHRGQYVIGYNANKLPNFVTDLIHPFKLYNF